MNTDEQAILALAEDLKRMYETDDISITRRSYCTDAEASPIIFDAVDSPSGEASTKGYDHWLKLFDQYVKKEGIFENRPDQWRQTYIDPAVAVSGDIGVLVSTLRSSWVGNDGVPGKLDFRYTAVCRRFEGVWKVWHEHFSASAKPEQMVEWSKAE